MKVQCRRIGACIPVGASRSIFEVIIDIPMADLNDMQHHSQATGSLCPISRDRGTAATGNLHAGMHVPVKIEFRW